MTDDKQDYTVSVDIVRGDFSIMTCTVYDTVEKAARAVVRLDQAMANNLLVVDHEQGPSRSTTVLYRGKDVVFVQCRPPLTARDIQGAKEEIL